MAGILLYALTSILYGALAVHFWRTRWRAGAARPLGIAHWERVAILVPLALHTALIHQELFAGESLRFGFGQALSITLWLAVLFYWVESAFVNLEGMQALVLPLAAVCAALPAIFPGLQSPPYAASLAFRAHLALAMLAYSLFTIGALHALLMALLEGTLHGGRRREGAGPHAGGAGLLAGPLATLPPLLTLERLLFRILGLGFVLLTLTLATGVLFSEEVFGKAFRFNHKTLFAVISWVIFASLLAGRWRYGWRGRKALRWTLAGFIALLLAYAGSRFVLEVVLGRPLG